MSAGWSGTGPPSGYELPPGWQPSDGPPPGWEPSWGYPPAPPSAPPPPPRPPLWESFRRRFHDAPVTVSIVVLTVAVWLVHLALQHWAAINTDLTLGDNGAGIHGQPWRLLTAMVVHFGIVHIGLNMVMLWQLGPPVEKVLGRSLFLSSYIVCGLAGSVLSDFELGRGALSGGASGAIVGIVGILVGNTAALHWLEQSGRRTNQQWRFNPSVARSLAIQIVIWIAFSSVAIPQIDNWAHVGGGVAGLVIGSGVAASRSSPA